MSQNQLKEAFISNLNGTTITEISLGLSVAPTCTLCRGLILVYLYQTHGERRHSWMVHLLIDFFILVLPQVVSCTIFSDYLHLVPSVIVAICVAMLYVIYRKWKTSNNLPFHRIHQSFVKARIENEVVPFVTNFRVFVNLLTAIAILAVDFPIFPRRYAKTETYGTGVMDFGVGGFIFGNALVSPEARSRNQDHHSRISRLGKQLMSTWPLIVLGLGRLVSVKSIDYYEHVSEYGVHWNFFFTLAVVKMLSSLLFTFFPAQKSWVLATVVLSLYQFVLEVTDLKSFILNGRDGKGSRVGFIDANREGLFSVIGYLAVYLVGVQFGLYILKKRTFCKDWLKTMCNLGLITCLFFVFFFIFQMCVGVASRRIANLTFCIWIVAQCLFLLCLIMLCELMLMFGQNLASGCKIPSTWKICQTYSNKKHGTAREEGKKVTELCLISAVNRNQLLFFLLSNIMTGLVNMIIDTIHSRTVFSLAVLLMYMFGSCLITYILHIKNITIKYW
uniref:Phosphatidylinositol-glycan biosynthesis class W protein n=1 Tax=Leptobrachium leishanense TaxID=445787 RepID=A0A8C5LP56_9ANUR